MLPEKEALLRDMKRVRHHQQPKVGIPLLQQTWGAVVIAVRRFQFVHQHPFGLELKTTGQQRQMVTEGTNGAADTGRH